MDELQSCSAELLGACSVLAIRNPTSPRVAGPGYDAGRAPRNKGVRYPVDPPTVEEIVRLMREPAEERQS